MTAVTQTLPNNSRKKETHDKGDAPPHSLAERQALLLSIAKDINSILDLDELLEHVASLVREVIPYHHFAIFLHDPNKKELS